jgi:hypothetical protein
MRPANAASFAASGSSAPRLSGHGGLAGENELRDVGKSDGVAAGDALASELSGEIAEEEVHFIGGGETVDVVEKFGSEDFRIDNGNAGSETVGMIGAECWARGTVRGTMMLIDQHMAALAFWADVRISASFDPSSVGQTPHSLLGPSRGRRRYVINTKTNRDLG